MVAVADVGAKNMVGRSRHATLAAPRGALPRTGDPVTGDPVQDTPDPLTVAESTVTPHQALFYT